VSKTIDESREWMPEEWQPVRLRMDEEITIAKRQVSFVEELALVATLLALAALVMFLV